MSETRIPPHSEEAEKSVLGALLIDKDAIVEVAEFLRGEMFYSRSNGVIFDVMMKLYDNRDPIDVLTVAEALKKKKELSKAGGRAYLSSLSNEVREKLIRSKPTTVGMAGRIRGVTPAALMALMIYIRNRNNS